MMDGHQLLHCEMLKGLECHVDSDHIIICII